MGGIFDDCEIPINCANCGHITPQKIGWLKANSQFICAVCGATIRLQAEELLRGIKQSERDVEEFKRSIAKMGPIKLNI